MKYLHNITDIYFYPGIKMNSTGYPIYDHVTRYLKLENGGIPEVYFLSCNRIESNRKPWIFRSGTFSKFVFLEFLEYIQGVFTQNREFFFLISDLGYIMNFNIELLNTKIKLGDFHKDMHSKKIFYNELSFQKS